MAPSSLGQVCMHQRRNSHFADSSHVAFGSVVHPLRVRSRISLLNAFGRAESVHLSGLVHSAIVGQKPRDAVWSSDFSLHTSDEGCPDVEPLTLRFDQKRKDATREVVDDSQQIQIALRSRNRKRAAEVGMEAFRSSSRTFEAIRQVRLYVRLAHNTRGAGRNFGWK